jgi:cysteine-S-conjugate beta-lyase
MQYNFDQYIERRGSDSGKWRAYDTDVLPLWVADMDFVSPEPVLRALHERIEHGIFGYPHGTTGDVDQTIEIRLTLVERMQRLYGWKIQPEEITFVPGVVVAFNLACSALATPDGAVLVQPPVYYPFLHAPENAGMLRQDAELSLHPNGYYEIDFDAFLAAFTDQTRLFILCNPHNPVGRVFRPNELCKMAEICLQKGVVICSDEIHCDLIYQGYQHVPIASLDPEIAQHTITLMAPSKTFNIPGLQFSFAIIQNEELRKKYQHSGKGLAGWINTLGWVAAQAAYQEGQEWLDQLLRYLQSNRDYLYDYVSSELSGVSMSKPEATYLAWLNCRAAEVDLAKSDPYKFFLEHARVALNNGSAFGKGGEGFVRLNFGCPRSVLAEALQRMGSALQEAKSSGL